MSDITDMSIYGFLARFKRGIARPNRYRVEFFLPSGIPQSVAGTVGVNSDALHENIRQRQNEFNSDGSINVKCHSATFPQRSLMTYEHKQNSAPFRLPYTSTYDPVTFSFYADSDLDTRDYFDIWQACVMNFGSNTVNFYDEYVSDVHIWQVDLYGNDTYGVQLIEAYPMNIGSFDVSYSNNDSYQTTSVTLAYKSWLPLRYTGAVGINRSKGAP